LYINSPYFSKEREIEAQERALWLHEREDLKQQIDELTKKLAFSGKYTFFTFSYYFHIYLQTDQTLIFGYIFLFFLRKRVVGHLKNKTEVITFFKEIIIATIIIVAISNDPPFKDLQQCSVNNCSRKKEIFLVF